MKQVIFLMSLKSIFPVLQTKSTFWLLAKQHSIITNILFLPYSSDQAEFSYTIEKHHSNITNKVNLLAFVQAAFQCVQELFKRQIVYLRLFRHPSLIQKKEK
ncbi:hypothetical protein CEXT_677611 [Caerostris extrusa]|uniref:Ribosomal protein S10 n=1 Tax=Caerostris extrusa TaxID=172846 RepID=A0AAV4NEZ4_CAEEX|nr:hypothetical protein CEXT_677611 [Caerostris extrusa]